MEYLQANGRLRVYPKSFGLLDLDAMHEFLSSRNTEHLSAAQDPADYMTDNSIFVRHDVDHSMTHALRFAEWEALRDLRSTYFVLHTAPYFIKNEAATLAMARAIQDMGHEVGIHHDVYSAAIRELGEEAPVNMVVNRASEMMSWLVQQFQDAGIEVNGCAAHGGDHNNLMLWEHYDPIEHGLYEAYQLSADQNYISDNRGELRAPLDHIKGKQTHVLIHPCHWQLP